MVVCSFIQPTAARTGNKCTFHVFARVVRYDLMVKSRYKNGYISLEWSSIDIQYKKHGRFCRLQVRFSSQNLDFVWPFLGQPPQCVVCDPAVVHNGVMSCPALLYFNLVHSAKFCPQGFSVVQTLAALRVAFVLVHDHFVMLSECFQKVVKRYWLVVFLCCACLPV